MRRGGGAAGRRRASRAGGASVGGRAGARGELRFEAAIDARFQAYGARAQIRDQTAGGQGMQQEVDAHVAVRGRDRVAHVVMKARRRVSPAAGAAMLRALLLEPHVSRHSTLFAARLDMANVAEQNPSLSIRRLIIEAHIVERDFRPV